MMRIPEYLEVAQWALLFALGALVVVLYRQSAGCSVTSAIRPRPALLSATRPRRSAIAGCRMATLANCRQAMASPR